MAEGDGGEAASTFAVCHRTAAEPFEPGKPLTCEHDSTDPALASGADIVVDASMQERYVADVEPKEGYADGGSQSSLAIEDLKPLTHEEYNALYPRPKKKRHAPPKVAKAPEPEPEPEPVRQSLSLTRDMIVCSNADSRGVLCSGAGAGARAAAGGGCACASDCLRRLGRDGQRGDG